MSWHDVIVKQLREKIPRSTSVIPAALHALDSASRGGKAGVQCGLGTGHRLSPV
jgi:hypothetical protein